jgi:hypothetical protein
MHTNWCVLIEISMETGMLNFWLRLLVTALTKETYFIRILILNFESKLNNIGKKYEKLYNYLLFFTKIQWCRKVKKAGGTSGKGWAESASFGGLTDLPKIWGPLPASLFTGYDNEFRICKSRICKFLVLSELRTCVCNLLCGKNKKWNIHWVRD